MFQEYNIFKQTGNTQLKSPVVKRGQSIILDIYWKQQDSIILVQAKGSNLEGKKFFNGGSITV